MSLLPPEQADFHANQAPSREVNARALAFADAMAELHASLELAAVAERAESAVERLFADASARLLAIDAVRGALIRESAEGLEIENIALAPATFEGRVALTGESGAEAGALCVALRNSGGRIVGVLVARASGLSARQDLPWLERLARPVAMAVENARLHGELKKGFIETAEALAEAIEKKDRCTGGHAKRVAHFAVRIGRELGLAAGGLERLRLSALLHDVGKIGIEDQILKKGAGLEAPEWSVMRTHPELGYQILRRISGMGDVVDGMRFHHERWDGRGYPLGLAGEEIPRVARIIAVADAYDAMISTRPYRQGIASECAAREIRAGSGTQFDPEVVAAFERAFLKIANP